MKSDQYRNSMKIDFHTHTEYSWDCLVKPDELVNAARRRGLDRVVVTDHNTIQGALLAYEIDPQLVIVGEEVQTIHGEFLACFVREEVPRGLSPQETIDRLRSQGAFISISHPFDPWRSGWSLEELKEIAPQVDGIEVFNGRCFRKSYNEKALGFAQEMGLPGTTGSDSHSTVEVGVCCSEMPPFSNAEELKDAIRDANNLPRLSPLWVRFYSLYARFYKKLTGRSR
jgi:predicted metal-dependent phosphoesterase TrpH